jgi:hypothetical protein
MNFLLQLLASNEHIVETINITLVKEQLVIIKDLGVNDHKALSNITFRDKLR